MTEQRRTTIVVSVVGAAAVTAYAVWAAIHILVLNPLAAVPGSSLAEIRGAIADAGELFSIGMVVGILAIGPVLAIAAAWVCIANRVQPIVAVSAPIALLILGAPGYFVASFAPGMALADTFMISGGSHSPWHLPLYAVSVVAAIGAIALAIGAAARARSAPATAVTI
jgi:hypothetical protein